MALLLVLLTAAVGLCRGAFVVEVGELKVDYPRQTMVMSVANFGKPIYGGTLRCGVLRVQLSDTASEPGGGAERVALPCHLRPHTAARCSGQLVYPRGLTTSFGCEPYPVRLGRPRDLTKPLTLSETQPGFRFASSIPSEPSLPAIAVVDRGPSSAPCPFTTKALNAQSAGAAAVLVIDSQYEPLITMDGGADDASQRAEAAIHVPCGLVAKSGGDALKGSLRLGNAMVATLSWTDIVNNTQPVVAWQFWSNSNDECGVLCDRQKAFLAAIAPAVTPLIASGEMVFQPRYITLACGPYADPAFCAQQCINQGRYCQNDPDGDFYAGYSGRDVVLENLRSLCVFKTLDAARQPAKWWQYATSIGASCSFSAGTYSAACATAVAGAAGADAAAVAACMGNPDASTPNALLEAEQAAQGDVRLFPTLIANGVQYRGTLDNATVLEFLCAAYPAGGAPTRCAHPGAVVAPCAKDGFGAQACAARGSPAGDGATSCHPTATAPFWRCGCPPGDTFTDSGDGKGFRCVRPNACLTAAAGIPACACPTCVCQALPDARLFKCSNVTAVGAECARNAGGCWQGELDGRHFTACKPDLSAKRAAGLLGTDPATVPSFACACPVGFRGDGVRSCVDVNECEAVPAPCAGPHMACINAPGSYACACQPGWAMDVATMTCIAASPAAAAAAKGPPASQEEGLGAGGVFGVVVLVLTLAGAGGFALYHFKLKKELRRSVRAEMSAYMPLGADLDSDMVGDYQPLRGMTRPLDDA